MSTVRINAIVRVFLEATNEGALAIAAQASSDYRRWILRGGYPAQVTSNGIEEFSVSVLDVECDRIGVCHSAINACDRQVEKWIACDSTMVQVVS